MREYFPHDYHARHDPKLLNLMKNEGLDALAIFWCVVEIMYEQSGIVMRSQCDGIAYSLHTSCDKVLSVLEKYDLFVLDGEQYSSPSINRRLDERKAKSEKAKLSSMTRWGQCERNANAMRPESESILLNKRKENKRKDVQQSQQLREAVKTTESKHAPNNSLPEPTPSDVEEYAKSIDYQIDGEAFVAHYKKIGWKDKNGHRITHWQSCVVTWKKRDKAREREKQNGVDKESAKMAKLKDMSTCHADGGENAQ